MAKQPFSAPKPRSLPTVTPTNDIIQVLGNWQTQLNPLVQNVAPQATPLNFSVTNSRGGLTLKWSPVAGGDGYEILKSQNGSFSDDLQVIPVKDINQSKFFDSTGGNSQKASYRIRTTSGTLANPQSQRGPESGVITHTSIDAADTISIPTTQFDNFTTDKTRSNARIGNYGAIRPTPLGKSGGATVGSGTKAASAPAGTPAVSKTAASSLGTGKITKATITVGAGASIMPDPSAPGIIDANQLQGTNVTNVPPTNGEILQVINGTLQYASIIAVGLQSALQSALPLALGEIYVASDTGNLFIGTPGVGLGYLQVGDTSRMNETLLQLLMEIRSMRLALTSLACQGGQANPRDFDPQALSGDAEIADTAQI